MILTIFKKCTQNVVHELTFHITGAILAKCSILTIKQLAGTTLCQGFALADGSFVDAAD